jgi:hypothetical protein
MFKKNNRLVKTNTVCILGPEVTDLSSEIEAEASLDAFSSTGLALLLLPAAFKSFNRFANLRAVSR